jgi:hypothetical protein
VDAVFMALSQHDLAIVEQARVLTIAIALITCVKKRVRGDRVPRDNVLAFLRTHPEWKDLAKIYARLRRKARSAGA